MDYVVRSIEDATLKISVKSIAFIYSYLCYEDAKLTDNLINAIGKGINDKEPNEFRPFFACIKKSFSLQDSLIEIRVLIN